MTEGTTKTPLERLRNTHYVVWEKHVGDPEHRAFVSGNVPTQLVAEVILGLENSLRTAEQDKERMRHNIQELVNARLAVIDRADQATRELDHALSLGGQLADWINEAGPAIRDLLDAYERRIRSLCSPAEIENRPWECAEWLRAREVLGQKPVAVVEIPALSPLPIQDADKEKS